MSDNDRYALLIGAAAYDSEHYKDLPPVRADLHYMQAVLESTEIGQYNDCDVVTDPTRAEMLHAIEAFLEQRQQSETALLYFSGHGEFCETDNQLYFLTRDSDPDDLPHTAVSAQFLESTLQSCRAASKIVLLDCCASGSVVQGWHAKGAGDRDADAAGRSTLLRPTGVYFITASDALQAASAMAPPGSTLGTSRFTGEIVEGLRTGRIKDGGWITPDDLFTYLTAQMVRRGVPEEQRPTKSTIRATQSLPFARSVARPVTLPVPPGEPGPPPAALLKARERAADNDADDRQRLLRYYAQCLNAQSAASMLPDRATGRNSQYFLLGEGSETIQSGRGAALAAPAKLPGADARSRSGDAAGQHEYWYGFPAITLPKQKGRGRGTEVRVAPLLLQPMELAPDEHGAAVLRPSGIPALHAGVVAEYLSDDEAADLLARWQPSWQHGNEQQMVKAIRELLTELGLPEIEPLDVSALRGESVADALRAGAHNAAVLLAPSGAERFAADGVVDNLMQIAARPRDITGTALDALLTGVVSEGDSERPLVVAAGPANESQEAVVASAMTRPLTVATGPPGTGKSEVVTAVVTTCLAAGQTVLVASTNNEAVDVVAERCDAIGAGLLMRTGNAKALVKEQAKLEALLAARPQRPPRGAATVTGDLRNLRLRNDAVRDRAAAQVESEVRLARVLQQRGIAAAQAGLAPELPARIWAADTAAADRWRSRAAKASSARGWWGRWRRKRAMSAFTAAARAASGQPLPPWADARPVPAEVLADITALVGLEVEVRTLLPDRLADDDHAVRAERETYAEERIRLSGELSEAVSTETLVRGAELMRQRLDTLQRRRGTQRSQRNLMAHMKGWAITTHAVRQLALEPKLFDLVVIDEASQCSIAAVVPLLFRARRALIIGDPMQLGHIPGISPEQERQARVRAGLTAAWLEDRRFAYHVYSAYHAAAQNGDAALLLDEHYRCRPEIADVVNGHCYASRLEVLTNVRGQVPPVGIGGAGGRGPGRVLAWSDVPNGQSMRGPGDKSWCNPAEAAVVAAVVKELLQELPETATVGVVTPFRAQKDALEREIGGDRVRVGTVHAFQGGQRDVMVLSPVATGNTPPGTAKWVANQVNLWNVAITRAKSQLITVGDHGFWRDQTGLPHVLATRSGLVSGGGAAPVPGSVPGVPRDPDRELLVDRVQQFLGARGVERDAVVGGYPVDLLFAGAEGPVAVLVDAGPIPGRDPARHLRLSQERARLLVGLPFEGRAGAEGVVDVIRVPAWRALAGDEALMPLLD